MENFDNTFAWAIAASILLGIILGGHIVLSIVRGVSKFMRPNYPSRSEYPPYRSEYRPESGGGTCLPVIFLLVVAFLMIKSAIGTSGIQGLLEKIKAGNTKNITTFFTNSHDGTTASNELPGTNSSDPLESVETSLNDPIEKEQFPDLDEPDEDPHLIQAGAFLNWPNAASLMQDFAMQGLQVGYTAEDNGEGETLYRVFLGSYSSIALAYRVQRDYKLDQAIIIRAEGVELNYFE